MRALKSRPFLAIVWAVMACEQPAQKAPPATTAKAAVVASAANDSAFASTPDSVWVNVTGPTLIAFHPVVSNDSLAKDEGLATALDDLAFHIGTAMDSLTAAGVTVHYQGGDTVWLRTGGRRSRFVRDRDSSDVGYVFADTAGHRVILYGVRGSTQLIADAHEFARTGTLSKP